jgi:hypothetical protein
LGPNRGKNLTLTVLRIGPQPRSLLGPIRAHHFALNEDKFWPQPRSQLGCIRAYNLSLPEVIIGPYFEASVGSNPPLGLSEPITEPSASLALGATRYHHWLWRSWMNPIRFLAQHFFKRDIHIALVSAPYGKVE